MSNQIGGGLVIAFENCRKTALVVEKNTRVLHSNLSDTKKTPTSGGFWSWQLYYGKMFYLCSSCVRSIIAVVVQNYLAGAAQIYIDYPPIYLPPNFKVKIV